MTSPLLHIVNLQVVVESKKVIDGLDLEVAKGEIVVVVGPNGSGKSSLAMTLLGDPKLRVLDGSEMVFNGQNLLEMDVSTRSRAGIFVGWQTPISIPGVSVFSFCKASYESHGNKISELVMFKKRLEELASSVGLPKEYVARNVNEGFSGGERKRLELLQLLLLTPKLVILDELDSGLDSHGVKILIKIIREMKQKGTSFILITHNKQLLENEVADKILEMKNGRLSARI